jgi:hypothetical protein
VSPLLTVVANAVTGITQRGYRLVNGPVEGVWAPVSGGASLQPATEHVTVVIALPVQAFQEHIAISEKTSLLQLVASIVGLTGLFAGFGFAVDFSRKALALRRAASKTLRGKAIVTTPEPASFSVSHAAQQLKSRVQPQTGRAAGARRSPRCRRPSQPARTGRRRP